MQCILLSFLSIELLLLNLYDLLIVIENVVLFGIYIQILHLLVLLSKLFFMRTSENSQKRLIFVQSIIIKKLLNHLKTNVFIINIKNERKKAIQLLRHFFPYLINSKQSIILILMKPFFLEGKNDRQSQNPQLLNINESLLLEKVFFLTNSFLRI